MENLLRGPQPGMYLPRNLRGSSSLNIGELRPGGRGGRPHEPAGETRARRWPQALGQQSAEMAAGLPAPLNGLCSGPLPLLWLLLGPGRSAGTGRAGGAPVPPVQPRVRVVSCRPHGGVLRPQSQGGELLFYQPGKSRGVDVRQPPVRVP